jgi:hypothetical protein
LIASGQITRNSSPPRRRIGQKTFILSEKPVSCLEISKKTFETMRDKNYLIAVSFMENASQFVEG